jgi:hypothetical protein
MGSQSRVGAYSETEAGNNFPTSEIFYLIHDGSFFPVSDPLRWNTIVFGDLMAATGNPNGWQKFCFCLIPPDKTQVAPPHRPAVVSQYLAAPCGTAL